MLKHPPLNTLWGLYSPPNSDRRNKLFYIEKLPQSFTLVKNKCGWCVLCENGSRYDSQIWHNNGKRENFAVRQRTKCGGSGPLIRLPQTASNPHTGPHHLMTLRSRVRYWMASATWLDRMRSLSARSAMVRTIFRIREWALALSPNLFMAFSSRSTDSGVQLAELPDLTAVHPGIGMDLGPMKALDLDAPGLLHPFQHGPRGLPCGRRGEVLVLHRRHLHVDVDPVQQGSGDLGSVSMNLVVRARALPLGIAQEPARIWIHFALTKIKI